MYASDEAPAPAPPRTARRGRWIGAGLVLLTAVGVLGICEWQGWPMLRRPAENWASERLDRQVSFAGTGSRWRLHLLGGVKLSMDHLEVGPPVWGTLGSTLAAEGVELELHYRDLFAFRRGQPLMVKSLEAENLALRIQRLADGRASWQFGPTGGSGKGFNGINIEALKVRKGTAVVDDKISTLSMVANFALHDGTAPGDKADEIGIRAEAEGRYRTLPMTASLKSGSALPWLSSDPKAPAVNVVFKVDVGAAGLDFEGQVRDLLTSQGLRGNYTVRGPSLAAAGQPLGITLPTTPPFAMQGSLTREGPRWTTHVTQATVGKSVLKGDFIYDRPGNETRPKLSGSLQSPILWLADLGPVIGTRAGTAVVAPLSKQGMGPKVPASAGPAESLEPAIPAPAVAKPVRTAAAGRVLPNRPFDLPSLRAMDADVQIRIERLESGNDRLQAIKPLNTHLILKDGVLVLEDIDARLAQGRIAGRVSMDGREASAAWEAQLALRGVRLEQWLQQSYVTGRLGAQIDIKGRGRSTADFLASADGRARLYWTRGTVSHLLVEMAGIDVAQSLGLMIGGNDKLPVTCAVADLRATQGMVRPKAFVIDTPDSAMRVDGGLSLATERLGLVLHVAPKDMSPLALRTPVDVKGSFANPEISLQKGPIVRRVLPALALATLTPLAALLPLIDTGDKSAQAAAEECLALLRQHRAL